MSSNEITFSRTQDLVIKALLDAKQENKRVLYFGELMKGVQKYLGKAEKIKPKELREAIGVLKNQGKIRSRELSGRRDVFYLIG